MAEDSVSTPDVSDLTALADEALDLAFETDQISPAAYRAEVKRRVLAAAPKGSGFGKAAYVSPVDAAQFLATARPLTIDLGDGSPLVLEPRRFNPSTTNPKGSFGWGLSRAVMVPCGEDQLKVQANVNLVVANSGK